jgi:CO dehydrogenase/acetyl-CoA synthase alpha subunit
MSDLTQSLTRYVMRERDCAINLRKSVMVELCDRSEQRHHECSKSKNRSSKQNRQYKTMSQPSVRSALTEPHDDPNPHKQTSHNHLL